MRRRPGYTVSDHSLVLLIAVLWAGIGCSSSEPGADEGSGGGQGGLAGSGGAP